MVQYVKADLACYRTPTHKLVRDFTNAGRDEFYDLIKDPDEVHNLINDSKPEVRRVMATLDAALTSRRQTVSRP